MAALGVKPPDGATAEPVFVVDYDGARDGEGLRVVRGETGLHAATVRETVARRPFHVGWEVPY